MSILPLRPPAAAGGGGVGGSLGGGVGGGASLRLLRHLDPHPHPHPSFLLPNLTNHRPPFPLKSSPSAAPLAVPKAVDASRVDEVKVFAECLALLRSHLDKAGIRCGDVKPGQYSSMICPKDVPRDEAKSRHRYRTVHSMVGVVTASYIQAASSAASACSYTTSRQFGLLASIPDSFQRASFDYGLVLADIDPATAKFAITITGPLLSAFGFLFIVRIVMSWYPKLPVGKFPYVVAYAPTEPILSLTRKVIPPLGGVDVTPVVWFGLTSFLSEILVGPQGLLVLLSQQR